MKIKKFINYCKLLYKKKQHTNHCQNISNFPVCSISNQFNWINSIDIVSGMHRYKHQICHQVYDMSWVDLIYTSIYINTSLSHVDIIITSRMNVDLHASKEILFFRKNSIMKDSHRISVLDIYAMYLLTCLHNKYCKSYIKKEHTNLYALDAFYGHDRAS